MKTSQVSVEFLFAVGLIVFIFIGLLAFNFSRNSDLRDSEEYLEEQNLCLKIASLMTSAYINGDGAGFRLDIGDHNASINPASKSIAIGDNKGYCIMAFNKYPAKVLDKGTTYHFRNKNGYIEIENA